LLGLALSIPNWEKEAETLEKPSMQPENNTIPEMKPEQLPVGGSIK
jgi:hypothetical protein